MLGFFWCSIVMLVSRARLVFLGVPLLCWYLAHAWFFVVFHCYVGISRMLGFFGVPSLCWYLAHAWVFLVFHCYVGISRTLGFFWCSIVTLVSRLVFLGLFWCSIVTLLSRLVFLGVPFLCWYLVHAWFFWSSIVILVSRARLVFFGVPLLSWYLAHAWFFSVFHCYVGTSRTLGFS